MSDIVLQQSLHRALSPLAQLSAGLSGALSRAGPLLHFALLLWVSVCLTRGITVSNTKADQQGLATVNPIFTWVRLAQRVPVRIRINEVPDGVRLVVGLTATVQIEPRSRRLTNRW